MQILLGPDQSLKTSGTLVTNLGIPSKHRYDVHHYFLSFICSLRVSGFAPYAVIIFSAHSSSQVQPLFLTHPTLCPFFKNSIKKSNLCCSNIPAPLSPWSLSFGKGHSTNIYIYSIYTLHMLPLGLRTLWSAVLCTLASVSVSQIETSLVKAERFTYLVLQG